MPSIEQEPELELEVRDLVAIVSLAGPGRGNSLGPNVWAQMKSTFESLDQRADVRAIILRGTGLHFTYGLDLQRNAPLFMSLMQGGNLAAQRARLRKLVHDWQDGINAIEACSKPVIAAIDGWCIGGGIDIIAAADWRLCSQQAQFSLREIKIAITADLGALQRLPHIIGQGATRRMAMTGANFSADEAREMKLVDAVYPDADALFQAAWDQAIDVTRNPPFVAQSVKEVLNRGRDMTLSQSLDYVATWNAAFLESNDLKEAISAFMERRDPHYQGD